MKKWDRNKCLLLGLLLVLMGIEARMIAGFTLTQEATETLAAYYAPKQMQTAQTLQSIAPGAAPRVTKKRVQLPRWLGLACLATGSVLILHSFVMPKPDSVG